MNKRRNKSVTKTKHRVQKTKRNRRLNKNRSVKGIRGNNKTKVVGKRRNIVQRGGARVEELIRAIRQLDDIINKAERTAYIHDVIVPLFSKEKGLFTKKNVLRDKASDETTDFHTPLYAACRLKVPSYELVQKMIDEGFNPRIPNGGDPVEYPSHGAIKAARDILNVKPIDGIDQRTKICEILEILKLLRAHEDKFLESSSSASNPSPLMKTAYSEFHNNIKLGKPISNVYDLLRSNLISGNDFVKQFELVLEKPPIGLASLPDGHPHKGASTGESVHPTGVKVRPGSDIRVVLKRNKSNQYFWVNPETDDKKPYQSACFEKRQDKELEQPFWMNPISGALTWKDPTGSIPVTSSASAALPAAASGLPAGWVEQIDSVSRRPYYVNTATGHSVWDRPSISAGAAHQTPQQYNAEYAQSHLTDGYYSTMNSSRRNASKGFIYGFDDGNSINYYFNENINHQLGNTADNAKDGKYYFGDEKNPKRFFRYLDDQGNQVMNFDGHIYKLFRGNP